MRELLRTERKREGRWMGFGLEAIVVGALACGCGGADKTNASNPADAPHVAVVKATNQSISTTLNIASEFQPYQEVTVYAKVSGYVQKLNVDWGTHVKQGQLLAVLEVPELQQQIDVDEASVRRGEQDSARAQEELVGSESAYSVAHLTYTRLANVQKTQPRLVAQQEVDEAQGKDAQADSNVSAAKDSVAASEQALAEAKASLEKDKSLYGYARISAPFDGVVTEIDAYKGALLPAGTSSNKGDQPLCHLSDESMLRLVIPIPESAVPSIKLGSSVDVRVPVLNKMYRGTVAHIADELVLSTRTMHTEIDIPNPKLEIVPGMYAEASLVLKSAHDVLTVPIQAIDRAGDTTTVDVADQNDTVEQRQVRLGIESPDRAEVLSGLKENDLVIVGDRSQLRPGSKVQPKLETDTSGEM
jgi:RND family efflux transporter MFP subunit